MRLQKINLSQIDFKDKSFALSFPAGPSKQLLCSIRRFGLISPPVLRKRARGKFQIITGFNRLGACQRLKLKEVIGQIVHSNVNEEQLFQMAISDNFCKRGKFNEIELSQMINKLEKSFSVEYIVKRFFALLGLHPSPELYWRLRPLVKLEKKLKLAIANEELTAGEGLEMLNLKAAERSRIFQLFSELRLTFSLRREFLENLTDIARRDGLSVNQIIDSAEIQAVLSNPELTVPVKVNKIRHIIKKWRYPQISKVEKKFYTILRRLGLPNSVRLIPPPFFETDDYKLELNFNSAEELLNQLGILNNQANSVAQALQAILDLGLEKTG